MRTVTLQIPLQPDLKDNAVVVARDYGFSSLQEIVRVFLTKLAKRRVVIRLEEAPVYLSRKNESRYRRMEADFVRGKDVETASSVGDLLKKLNET